VKFSILIRTAAAAALVVALAGCTVGASPSPSPAASIDVLAEVAATVKGLDDALAKYREGDAAAADQLAGDAYLEHFENVEHPLEEVDEELTEELEELIRDELRAAIKAGKPVAEIEALVNEAKAGLAKAATLLQ
jgi:hypothetical protein